MEEDEGEIDARRSVSARWFIIIDILPLSVRYRCCRLRQHPRIINIAVARVLRVLWDAECYTRACAISLFFVFAVSPTLGFAAAAANQRKHRRHFNAFQRNSPSVFILRFHPLCRVMQNVMFTPRYAALRYAV
jgi:hypothetical protein